MEKQTMGKFIATLRKANGMTQAQLADKLMVSNRTVSKWETDEGFPDISMIPILAEIFEVSTDEILKGARIPKNVTETKKTDKQIERLINKTLLNFRYNMLFAVLMNICGWLLFSVPIVLDARGLKASLAITIIGYIAVIFLNALGVLLMFFFSSRAKYALSGFDRNRQILKSEKVIGDWQFLITTIALLSFIIYWLYQLAETNNFLYYLTGTAFSKPLRVSYFLLIALSIGLFVYILKLNFQTKKYYVRKDNMNKSKIWIRHCIFFGIMVLVLVWGILANFTLLAIFLFILTTGLYLFNLKLIKEKYYIKRI
ncbi:MAG: helix-turn-helix domain-containing protein [Erysipelotrichales bacterium]|nr:helix-turn-helix domain-containing protein [Erysipelotrichales bacterium]